MGGFAGYGGGVGVDAEAAAGLPAMASELGLTLKLRRGFRLWGRGRGWR